MAKQNLLLVDADFRSLRVLAVSLRKAGYNVSTAHSGQEALDVVRELQPDLILSDTQLPGMDGFELVQKLRQTEGAAEIPFMFLSSDASVESKVKGLELGVQDYLAKPIYIKEILTRVSLELQRRKRQGLEVDSALSSTRFTGSLADMGVVDLLQTIDISRKSGTLTVTHRDQRGIIYFDAGKILAAELGKLEAEAAVYRILIWSEGTFEIEFRPIRREAQTDATVQAILMEGLRRVDEWERVMEQLPPLDSIVEVHGERLVERLAEIPDEINRVLKHIDGRRTLMQVIDQVGDDDLAALGTLSKLFFEGLVVAREAPVTERPSVPGPPSDSSELTDPAINGVVPGGDTLRPAPDRQQVVEDETPQTRTVPYRAAKPHEAPPPAVEISASAEEASSPAGLGTAPAADSAESLPKTPVVPSTQDSVVAAPPPEVESETDSGDSTLGPDTESDPQQDGEEASMRKGKRKKKRSVSRVDEAVAESNVIQFPAKAPRSVVESQLAVGSESRAVETLGEPAPSGPREDRTDVNVRTDEQPQVAKSTLEAPRTNATILSGSEDPAPAATRAADSSDGGEKVNETESPYKGRRRAGGGHTTSSQMIRALSDSSEHGAVTEDFFKAKNYEANRDKESWSDLKMVAEPLSSGARKAKVATFVIVAVSVAAIGGYYYYQNHIMPQEVHLPAAPPVLPTPAVVPPPSPTLAPTPIEAAPTDPAIAVADPDTTQGNVEPAPAPTDPVAEPAPGADPAQPAPANSDAYAAALAEAQTARRPRDAEAAYRRAIELNPQGAEALSELAWLEVNRSRYQQAAELAERAVAADPNNAQAWLSLGAAKQVLGDRDGYRAALARCIEVGGTSRWARFCRQM